MATVRRFEDLRVWQLAREVVGSVYDLTKKGPLVSDWALRDQLRRSSTSILSNIAEGFERDGNREFAQFLSIAKGSVGEVRAQLYLAKDAAYIDSLTCEDLQILLRRLAAGIGRLIQVLTSTQHRGLKYR